MKIAKILFIALWSVSVYGQSSQIDPKPNWYNLDLASDGMFGVSMEKAYQYLLKGKKPKTVVVAVIDGGLDIYHEDIKNVVWRNAGEIPDNGKDDDKNGYIDDLHGWNFLGCRYEDFEYDNDLLVLEVRKYLKKFGNKDSTQIAKEDLPEYRIYRAKSHELDSKLKEINQKIRKTSLFLKDLIAVLQRIGKDSPTLKDFEKLVPVNNNELRIKSFMITVLQKAPDFKAYFEGAKDDLATNEKNANYLLNLNYDPRAKYPKEYDLSQGILYGNANVYGSVPPAHGTHVAGILAADRRNGIGINGVADAIKIMPIRAVPQGYIHERDEASAIYYAVNNGAKVITMSFGLCVAMNKKLVEDAVNYAIKKDVLFIQAAGNGHDNLDLSASYPNRQTEIDKKFVNAFIKVGASGFTDDEQLAAPFSNYGKQSVDVFAPGLGINSTVPGNKYEAHSGSSMAAPVVAGLSAVIRAYYPRLKATQVKEIIMKSVVKRAGLKDLCVTGGIVNAYEALKLAGSY